MLYLFKFHKITIYFTIQQASGASGSAKNQTAVTTQSEIEARTQVTSQEATETQTTQSGKKCFRNTFIKPVPFNNIELLYNWFVAEYCTSFKE